MACGKTVLMAKTKGLFNNTELKNMKNIVFFKPNNPNLLKKKISLLLGNGKLRENIGKNARQTVIQNFTLHHMADCISQVIKRLSKFLQTYILNYNNFFIIDFIKLFVQMLKYKIVLERSNENRNWI